MFMQVEITTRCNFDCFYCAGRAMPQGDMPMATFTELLDSHIRRYGVPDVVSLQGEGEPSLHGDFFAMAELVRARGSRPYTITNGSFKHPERFVGRFDSVGVSLDTLDEAEGRRIGRYNIPRVLAFIEVLAPQLPVIVHTVALSPSVHTVIAWCKARGLQHIVQPLQGKADYRKHYPDVAMPIMVQRRFACDFVAHARTRYYALDGTELPCCYVKDTSGYLGIAAMQADLAQGKWPVSCHGCKYGNGPKG